MACAEERACDIAHALSWTTKRVRNKIASETSRTARVAEARYLFSAEVGVVVRKVDSWLVRDS